MRYIKKMSISDIAQAIDIPYSTLRLRLIRLEKSIKSQIHNEAEEFIS